jgi:phosphoribosyl-AMP cyclohydrolase
MSSRTLARRHCVPAYGSSGIRITSTERFMQVLVSPNPARSAPREARRQRTHRFKLPGALRDPLVLCALCVDRAPQGEGDKDADMDFTKLDGLIPAVVQDSDSDEVLMVGFMNETALERTLSTGFATFYSRSRQSLWTKGETSGNRLKVDRMLVDCDNDTVVLKVTRLGDGNVCHTGTRSCFRELESAKSQG